MRTLDGKVTYGKQIISFKVLPVRRKTLEIAVHPDCTVVIKAPQGTKIEEVRKRVLKRARWIKRQQVYFRQFEPRTTVRHYIGGETHLYLGKQYRLKISTGNLNEVKLTGGYFQIRVRGKVSSGKVRSLLEHWYIEKAINRFNDSFEKYWPYFERLSLARPRLQVRRMHKRWGSLSGGGSLSINIDLIRASQECIDYVIVHELCHLQYHHHGPEFYRLLGKVLPDWELRKHKLEMALS